MEMFDELISTTIKPNVRLWRVLKVDDEKVVLVKLRGWKRMTEDE